MSNRVCSHQKSMLSNKIQETIWRTKWACSSMNMEYLGAMVDWSVKTSQNMLRSQNSFHEKLMHAGVSHILAAIRREFWIPQRRSSVRRVLLNCLRCRRHQGGPYRMPAMAPYPWSRIEESPPFTYTSLDCHGPLYVKVSQPSATQKVWLRQFTCLHVAVRAIHLEVIHDMTAEQFLLCLRRFIATHENRNR